MLQLIILQPLKLQLFLQLIFIRNYTNITILFNGYQC